MSVFADHQVKKLVDKKEVIIDPYFDLFQGSNCYHCHLGSNFKRINPKLSSLDPLSEGVEEIYEDFEIKDSYKMKPGEFLLGETFEYLGTNLNYVIKLLNSSSLARVGISQAALGMINAGCGMKNPIRLTLELINNSPIPIVLKPTKILRGGKIVWGTEVLKIAVYKMDKPPSVSYDRWKYGVYSRDSTVAGSKMAGRFTDNNCYIPNDSIYKKVK